MSESAPPIRFHCVGCRAILQMPRGKAGTEQRCPKCQARILVPTVRSETAVHVETAADDSYELWGTEQPRPDDPWAFGPFITVICHICGTRLSATPDQIGTNIRCPDCYHHNLVPQPAEPPKRKRVLVEEGESLDVEAPVERLYLEPLVTSRALDVEDPQFEDNQPLEVRWPFFSGVFTFPFGAKLFGLLAALAVGFSISAGAIILAFALFNSGAAAGGAAGGAAGATAAFLMAIGSVVACFCAAAYAACMLAICTDTASGNLELVSWPDGGISDWFLELAQLATCAAFASMPGSIFYVLLGGDPLIRLSGIVVTLFVLLPFFVLSTLETTSVSGLFSSTVWRSLKYDWQAWAKFYSLTALSLAAFGLLVYLCWSFPLRTLLVALLGVGTSMIYFRLLGRLAWVCSEYDLPDVNADDDNEASCV